MALLWAAGWTIWQPAISSSISRAVFHHQLFCESWIPHCFLHNSFVLCLDSTQLARTVKRYLSSKASDFRELFPRNYSIWKLSHIFLSPGMLLMSLSQTGAQAQWTAWGTEQRWCLFKGWKAWVSLLWYLVHLSQDRTWKNKTICSKKYVLVIWVKILEQFRHFRGKWRQWKKCCSTTILMFLPPPYPQK